MGKRIVILDDDQTLVSLLKDGLESLGYNVAAAFDGVQGLRLVRQAKPDAIILDFNMPGGGGQSVYERLRRQLDGVRVPIIFSTAVASEELKKKLAPSAHTYFLKKPVGLNQIAEALRHVLGGEAPKPQPPAVPKIPSKPAAPRWHEFSVRVTYADTDKMGIIYYANYFKYFEQGRTELMRSLGIRYRDLEVQRKLYIPVIEASCRYLAPSRYDDLLVVRTWISDLGRASVRFENAIYDKDLGGKKVARGFSRHALVNDLWRTTKAPEDLRSLLAPYVGEPPEDDEA